MNVNFDLEQIITIASVVLVVIGWFVNQWLNRRNEIAKERRRYRIDMLDSIPFLTDKLNLSESFKTGTLNFANEKKTKLFIKIINKVHTFGKQDEVDTFLGHISKHNPNNVTPQQLSDLSALYRKQIRKELKLEKLK